MSTERNGEDEVPQDQFLEPGPSRDGCGDVSDASAAHDGSATSVHCDMGQGCKNMWINDHCDVREGGCAATHGAACCMDDRLRGLCKNFNEDGAAGPDCTQPPPGAVASPETCAETRSLSSDELSNDGSGSPSEDKSIRKGRFVIEQADAERSGCLSTLQYRRGRFQVTEAIELENISRLDSKKLVSIISLQNKQIDILFDMIKNISGGDRLFQKEFTMISNDVYELIGSLKKHGNT